MLNKLNKIAPYLAVVLLGYLCHSEMSSGPTRTAKGKDAALISQELLHPELLAPEAHASPVNRDPFEVRWASYRENAALAAGLESAAKGESADGAASADALDEEGGPPPLPKELKGVLRGDSAQYVVVGDRICKPGDLVSGNDPRRSWVVERVDVDGVVLRFGNVRRKIEMSSTEGTHPVPASAPSEDVGP